MNSGTFRGPVVVDTNVFGLSLRRTVLEPLYRPLVEARDLVLSFMTVTELRYGARRANWGQTRRRRLEHLLSSADVVHSSDLLDTCADLRVRCDLAGHGLAQRVHEADRWIAATAIWLELPLVTHDRIFLGVDGLEVLTTLDVKEQP